MRSGECNVVSLYVLCCPVNGSVCFLCCVFVNSLMKQFAKCLGVFVILLLNVMELLTVVGGALLDRPCMVFVIFSFRSFRAGPLVFAPLMFLCVILHTMSSGKSLQLLCIFPFGMLCLSAISMMSVNIMLAVCILVGMVV